MSNVCPHDINIVCSLEYRHNLFLEQVANMRKTGSVVYQTVWANGSSCNVFPERCEKLQQVLRKQQKVK